MHRLEGELLEVATLGGGCFWCTEAVFLEIEGVTKVVPGYSGGHVKNPSYQQVITGTTGHVEVIQVTFDPEVIPFREILEIFFTMHDPTSMDRQGADVGTQYRSVIFYHDEEQRGVSEGFIAEMNETIVFNLPIVTRLEPFNEFYEAEDYHVDYYNRNKQQGYSRFVIEPKLRKVEAKFEERIKGRRCVSHLNEGNSFPLETSKPSSILGHIIDQMSHTNQVI